MTKARGATDSIGKAGREASFLLPAFSPYYVPYFPLFLRARINTHTIPLYRTRIYLHVYLHVYTRRIHARVLFPFCPPPRLRRPSVLFYTSPPSMPFSFCLSLLVIPPPSSSSSLLYVYACIHMHAYVCVRLVSIVVRGFMSRAALRSRGEREALYVGERENVF